MATTDYCDGDYLGAYRRFLEHFVTNVCARNDQLPVKMSRRDLRECELAGEIADIALQHLNQRICPPSLQAYLVKLVRDEFKLMFQKHPEDCGYRPQDKTFSPLKLMQAVTNKVNEICQRYLDNSRLALLPPPPSIPLPLASSYAIRNRRRKMEDRSVVLHDLHTMFSIKNDSVVNYYAVFDGHAGQEAATYCAAHLHQYLIESPYYPMEPELALRDAFHTTDYRFIEIDESKNSGATAVCALLYDKTLYIAWAGDSQAALIKNGRGINLTIPHKPERPDEKLRINSLGGEVIYFGSWRVNGVLNVSRAIGDVKYKPFITEEPEIKKIDLDGTEDVLVIACDGFWERATEDIVASLIYEFVCSGQCDYSSASEALVNWAKQNQSEDNISVIVVFLTPPAEIAAKSFFDPRPVQSSATSMEPGYQQDQQPYDLDFSFAKQQPPTLAANGNEDGFGIGNAILEPINGRHRPKPPKYNDDDDDDDEDEEEDEEDVDLGPETNVDMVDEAPVEDYGKLDQAMGQNYPDEFLGNVPAKNENDDFPMDGIKNERHQNELIPEADNVADSEDSEDEWNYYRPDDKKNADLASSPAPSAPEPEQDIHEIAAVAAAQPHKDPALVEKADQCEEERELCSPKPSSEDGSSVPLDNSNRPLSPEGDDVTAELDELLEHEPSKEQVQPETLEQELKEHDIEAEATLPQEDLPFDKTQPEEQHQQQQFEELEQSFEQSNEPHPFEQPSEPQPFEQPSEPQPFEQPREPQPFEQPSEPQLFEQPSESQPFELPSDPLHFEQSSEPQLLEQSSELQHFEQSSEPQKFEQSSEPQHFEKSSEPEHFEKPSEPQIFEQSQLDLDQFNDVESKEIADILEESKENVENEVDDMESHLNPDAAEFVPTVTTPPLIPQLISQMDSDLVAGSPLKQSQRCLKNRKIPSEEEFQQEICRRPSEIDDSSDFSNGESSPIKEGGFDAEGQKTMVTQLNLDDSEISSTKAEFGDETANFSVASELYKTGISTIDCSYTGSDRGEFNFSKTDAMATSMTPGDFKTAFEQEPDLNKVHELNDDDLMGGDVQNGSFQEKEKKMMVDDVVEDLGKDKIELDLDNFVPQQEQNAEVFSSVVEQRESDNKDLFMNLRNAEHGYEFDQPKEEPNLIDTMEHQDIASAEDVKIGGFTTDEMPTYASNNPFAADYVPEPEHNIQNLADDLQNVQLDEPKQQLYDESSLLTPEEPIVEKETLADVMQNPLDLNFGATSAEQKIDEPVLVSPVKEPEVMSSKFEEENLMSQSVEGLQPEPVQQPVQELFMQSNHVEDFSPVIPQPEENFIKESPLEEVRNEIVESLERKSINLSESLQEFTGLEEQLSPKQQQEEVKDNIIEEPQILKENLVDEQKDVEEVTSSSLIPETKIEETPVVTNERNILSNETAEDVAAPVAAVAAAAVATTAVAAVSAAVVAAKKPAAAASKTSKPTTTSKIGAKTSPTTPTKAAVGAKAGTTAAAKKPTTTSLASRTKPLTGIANKTATGTAAKAPITKSTASPKPATSAAAKPAPRTSTTAAAPRTKPLSSITSKISSTSTDKKPTANGEVKSALSKTAPKLASKPPATSTASKTGLVKATSTTSRTSTGPTTTTAKPRPISAATTKTTISKVNSTNVTSSTNTTAARPKTAPTSTLNAMKSKVGSTGAKSPMIDKQIKETANKQISSARTTSTATKSRLSMSSTNTTTTTTTKRTSLVQKQTVPAPAASPVKKPAPITKPGSKTSTATSKVNSKVTSTTKTTTAETKVVQNGVCEAQETKITTNTTTTNIEEDIPKKDVSPIEPLTDNQLITAE